MFKIFASGITSGFSLYEYLPSSNLPDLTNIIRAPDIYWFSAGFHLPYSNFQSVRKSKRPIHRFFLASVYCNIVQRFTWGPICICFLYLHVWITHTCTPSKKSLISHITGQELCEIKPMVEKWTKTPAFLFSDRFSVFLIQLRRCARIVKVNFTSKKNKKIKINLKFQCHCLQNESFRRSNFD